MRAALLMVALALPGTASSQDSGEALFNSYCAGCHGVSATGDGPMASLISVPVADLTQLAARNNGAFPLLEVIQTVDGRRSLLGHGGPMPVFGPMLGGGSAVVDGPGGSVLETRGDVLSIVDHLMQLQK